MQLDTFLNTQSRSTKGIVGGRGMGGGAGYSLWFMYHHISKGGPRSDLTTDLHEMKQMLEWTSAKGNKNGIFLDAQHQIGGLGGVGGGGDAWIEREGWGG